VDHSVKTGAVVGRQLWELFFQVILLGVVLCAFVQVFSFGGASVDLNQPLKGILYTRSGDSILASVRHGATLSFWLVGGALAGSLLISAALGWLFAATPWTSFFRLPVVLVSAFPVFALGYWMRQSAGIPYLAQGILVLALGDLVLASMTSEMYVQMRRELGRGYVLAAQARGEAAWRHYWRRFLVIVLESARPRIPFLLGSSVVVERVYAFDGLGELAVSAAERAEVAVLIWLALLSLLVVRAFGVFVEVIRGWLTPEVRKTDLGQEGQLRQFFRDTLEGFLSLVRVKKPGHGAGLPQPLSLHPESSIPAIPSITDPDAAGTTKRRNPLSVRFGNYLLRSRWDQAKAGVAALAVLCALVFTVACLAGHGSQAPAGLGSQFAPPSESHWLGLDEDGKDILSQLLSAGRLLVPPAVVSLLAGMLVAVPFGVLSGYFGGRTARLVDRFMDVLDSAPKLVLVLLAIVVFEAKEGYLWKVVPFIGLTFAPAVFYQVRDSARHLRERLFVERARALGCSEARIVFLHVLWHNSRHRLLMALAYVLGGIILMDASVGYLELSQPDYPTWGALAVKGVQCAYEHAGMSFYWGVWGPIGVLVLMMTALSMAGDGLRVLLGDE
jgi:ABC-type dipeptide/oligopeptide/nickel transport system permease subunit